MQICGWTLKYDLKNWVDTDTLQKHLWEDTEFFVNSKEKERRLSGRKGQIVFNCNNGAVANPIMRKRNSKTVKVKSQP